MSACCGSSAGSSMPCPSCGNIGPIVGVAPVRPHRADAADSAWQHCAKPDCSVVYYFDAATVGTDTVITKVGHKAPDRPTPVCYCFAHTVDDVVADAVAHDGVSTIKAEIKQALDGGHCACEQLNPSTKCCLANIHRTLKAAVTVEAVPTP